MPGLSSVNRVLRRRYTGTDREEPFFRGHYHSPLPDYADLARRSASLFSGDANECGGIDLQTDAQLALLREMRRSHDEYDWPAVPVADRRFYAPNRWFDKADAAALVMMMRHFRPRRVIEVGSGFSSALMLDVDERFMQSATTFTFIEPNPEERLMSLLGARDRPRVTIIRSRAEDLALSAFGGLAANDVLFIDSSHVTRIGSDVNHLVFDVLPTLAPGVLVHFHDIFWPFEYPKEWVLGGFAWNEAYLVRAFLQYNLAFEIVLFNSYLSCRHAAMLKDVAPHLLERPGSLWIRRTSARA